MPYQGRRRRVTSPTATCQLVVGSTVTNVSRPAVSMSTPGFP